MKQQLIVSIPDATDFDLLPPQMVEVFSLLQIEAPTGWTMPGTQAYQGRRLVHLQSAATPSTIEWLIGLLNGQMGVGWDVEAAQEFKLMPERDEQGEPTGEYVGVYRKVLLSVLNYLADQYDENGDPLPRRVVA